MNADRDVYTWWSNHPRALKALYTIAFVGREEFFRTKALETLSVTTGDRILEFGCGTGNSLQQLRDLIGPTGTIIGFDRNYGMVQAARDRVCGAGWENIHIIRADAQHPPVTNQSFDAVYAAMSLTAVQQPRIAIRRTYDTLHSGGELVLLDAQPFNNWPGRLANRMVIPLAKLLTNWVPNADVISMLDREFDAIQVQRFHGGSIVIVRACKQ